MVICTTSAVFFVIFYCKNAVNDVIKLSFYVILDNYFKYTYGSREKSASGARSEMTSSGLRRSPFSARLPHGIRTQ